jgi:hypothetical protein
MGRLQLGQECLLSRSILAAIVPIWQLRMLAYSYSSWIMDRSWGLFPGGR